ncbi:hypothetical protein BXT84_00685 [Sulfobacillus thermotolerans]|uniref:Uncharacterized protein n=1 Tax=Sulfobacillus thermotolerans TaxID=338644 RepID=A0ABN5GW67_9FIRM|nr:hypothetical protein BXT84_00685 [Sulfobacillus thermotolerans]
MSRRLKIAIGRASILAPLAIVIDVLGLGVICLAEFLTAFIEAMPVVNVSLQMRRLQHQNPQRQWHPNNHYDIEGSSVVVVHCDIIVTERHWAHRLQRAKLPERHRTTVLRNIPDLIAHLVRA